MTLRPRVRFWRTILLAAIVLSTGLAVLGPPSAPAHAQSCPTSCPYDCQQGEGGSCPLGFAAGSVDYCAYASTGCPNGQTAQGNCCCDTTPIVLDIEGDGIELTDAYGGVYFDVGSDGHADLVAWTHAGSDDAWLCLDRNGNGVIDDAQSYLETCRLSRPA